MSRSANVGFVSLGCPKALVDSERILTRLTADGYRTVPRFEDADVVVVNTCGFIDAAVDESLDTIEEVLGSNGRVIVTGCLGTDSERLIARFPNLLAVTGPAETEAVLQAVHQHVPLARPAAVAAAVEFENLLGPAGVKLTPPHYAYLKISEGCNHTCSFCIIPSMRGKLRSRPIDDVLEEAERLARAGVQEVMVIAQDTSAYGVDLRYRPANHHGRALPTDLLTLCRELGRTIPWVRLHYVYPYPHVDALIPLMADGLLLPYLDIPLQHADPALLRAMRRPAAIEDTLRRISEWRRVCPELALRSTFIVGFPGETDAAFDALLDFLEAAELDRVGCFAYSNVSGARANVLPGHVEERVKLDRQERLMELQACISERKLARRVGERMEVLVDAVDGATALARGRGDAPDVDGMVHVHGAAGVVPGERVWVRITASDVHDLFGEHVGKAVDLR